MLLEPLHHIIVRGIERRRIFENNADRDIFFTPTRRYPEGNQDSPPADYAWAKTKNFGSGCQQISHSR